jgi:GTP-binding protein
MFVDEITIRARAGRGGDGVVRWLHVKSKEYAGPSGGDGGRGGDVYARGVRDIGILARYRNRDLFDAENGGDGEINSRHGADGDDLMLDVPIGSVITNTETEKKFEVLREGEQVLLLSGVRGGLGNEDVRRSIIRSPTESTKGKVGEEATFEVELNLIVDAGFIGLPNAGKSSLLNALTNAQAKVGSYAFTTLDPNLGDLYGFILADIPGLIEGASAGRGLGHKFLRHVRRTKMLLHCVSLEEEDPVRAYDTVRAELSAYGEGLTEKEELIVLTKSDTVSPERAREVLALMCERAPNVSMVSVIDDGALKQFRDDLVSLLRAKSSSATI